MIHLANDPNLDKWDDKLQSEVITYNLSKPMTMIGFVSLPDHAQKEYLQILKKNGGSTAQIAEMLGCSTETVLELMKRNGIRAGGRRTDDAAFLWAEFIKDYEMPPMETPTASIKAPAHPETPQKAPETPRAEDVPEPPPCAGGGRTARDGARSNLYSRHPGPICASSLPCGSGRPDGRCPGEAEDLPGSGGRYSGPRDAQRG